MSWWNQFSPFLEIFLILFPKWKNSQGCYSQILRKLYNFQDYFFIASWQQWLLFRERMGEILRTSEMLPRYFCSRGQSTKHRQAGIQDKAVLKAAIQLHSMINRQDQCSWESWEAELIGTLSVGYPGWQQALIFLDFYCLLYVKFTDLLSMKFHHCHQAHANQKLPNPKQIVDAAHLTCGSKQLHPVSEMLILGQTRQLVCIKPLLSESEGKHAAGCTICQCVSFQGRGNLGEMTKVLFWASFI